MRRVCTGQEAGPLAASDFAEVSNDDPDHVERSARWHGAKLQRSPACERDPEKRIPGKTIFVLGAGIGAHCEPILMGGFISEGLAYDIL
jgi:hypothetical protein